MGKGVAAVSSARTLGLRVAAVGAMLTAMPAVPAAEPPPAGEPPFKPVRELYVPFRDLSVLLHGGTERVLLSREEFDELTARAKKEVEVRAPIAALSAAAEYDVAIGEGRALIAGLITVSLAEDRLHAVALDLSGVGLRSARLDGEPAPLGLADDGRVTLLVEGKGEHRLDIEAVTPLETTAAQQTLNFRLPTPPATRLRLTVPGDVEVRSGAAVIRREFDERRSETRFELLPSAADVSLVMTLNSRLQRRDRVVMARSVLVAEVTEAYERLHATVSLDILHRAVKDFRFVVPDGFEVTDVQSPHLSQWVVIREASRSLLAVGLRRETTESVVLALSAVRTSPKASTRRANSTAPMPSAR